jgi:hypothetical protein
MKERVCLGASAVCELWNWKETFALVTKKRPKMDVRRTTKDVEIEKGEKIKPQIFLWIFISTAAC